YLKLIGESEDCIPSADTKWIDIEQNIGPVTDSDPRMSPDEKMEMDLTQAAQIINGIAGGIDYIAQPLAALPTISANAAPLGVGASISPGGSNLAAAVQIGSVALKTAASIISEEGNRSSRKGQLIRQLQDRRLQANIRGREIKAIDQQIERQKTRLKAASKDIEMQKSEMQEAQNVESWYRTNIYFQAYTLALSAARQAESALSFEQGRVISAVKQGGYWDAAHDGLMSADHLFLDLKRLESASLDGPSSDFDVSKTISLRQIDTMALLRLRLTGSTNFLLSEILFDMDFPGHFMRRIRSVALSLPAVLGPHTGVNATLTLLQHRYRISPSAADYNTNNDLFRSDRIPISSVAISSGSHDAGVFELNFSGAKYLPFEGAGAISTWRLELPTEIRKFDYETISDVLLHVQYSSRDGGPVLREAANDTVRKAARAIRNEGETDGFCTLWNLKNDFVNAWYGFSSRIIASKGKVDTISSMELGNLKDRLPFWSRKQKILEVKSVTLISKSATLVRGITVPKATGEGVKWDEGKIGDCTMRTCKGLSKRDWKSWVVSMRRRYNVVAATRSDLKVLCTSRVYIYSSVLLRTYLRRVVTGGSVAEPCGLLNRSSPLSLARLCITCQYYAGPISAQLYDSLSLKESTAF
ncbi:hypothetical protein BCR34DRAFT_647183, partial [Clohesyomyces aquaticus]